MAGSYHTCVGSLQHSPRKMVCQHHRFPGHWRLQVMATPRHIQEGWGEETSENIFKAFADTLEVSTSHWNHIDEMYSDIRQGEQETTDQLDQCIKILVERCGYTTEDKKKAMPTRATLPCHETLQSQEVGQITDSTEGNCHLQQATTTCQTAWGNH